MGRVRAPRRGSEPTGLVTELHRSHVALLAALAALLVLTLLSSGYLILVTSPAVDRLIRLTSASRLMHQAILNQETGLMGWVATGDDVFLQPYEDGRAAVDDAASTLVGAAAVEPELMPLVVDAMLARQAWQAWADDVVGEETISGLTPDATTRVLLEGKELFDAYRVADERATGTVVAHRDQALRDERSALVASLVASLVTVATAGVAATHRRRRIVRTVVRPVDEVLATIESLRSGDLSARVPCTGVTELDAMGAALGDLAAELRTAGELAAAREERLALLAERLASVVRIAREVSGSVSVRYVAESVTSAAAELLASPVTLWVRTDDGSFRAARRSDDPHGVVPPSDTPVPSAVAESAADARPVADRAGAAHPLVLGGMVVGVLHVAEPRPADDTSQGDGLDADAEAHDEGTLSVLAALLSTAAAALESARLHSTAREQAEQDALTQLPNRRRLEADLALEWERSFRYDRPLTFLMVDLDHFKRLNDEHGHLVGDAVLHEVAAAVARTLRSTDTAYRYGGEELAVLLRETDADAALPLAERLRETVAAVVVPGTAARVTASVGLAPRTTRMRAAAELVEAADAALYTAKRSGRDRVALADAVPVTL